MFGLFKSSNWNVFFVWGMVFFHLRLAFFRVASPATAEAFQTAAPVKATTSSAPVCPYGLMFPHQTAAAGGIKALHMAPRSLYRSATASATSIASAARGVSKHSATVSPAAMASQLSAGFHTWRHFQVHAASKALGLTASSYADFDTICHRSSTPKLRSLRLQSTTTAIAPEIAYAAESKTVAASSSSSSSSASSSSTAASEKLAKQLADATLEVVTLGLSHHNAKVEIREQLAVPEDQWHTVAQQLAALPAIREAAVLSTCNRFELYLAGPNAYEVMREAMQFLLQRAQERHTAKQRHAEETGVPAPSVPPLDEATLRRNLFLLAGEDAIWHLLRVAAGLDSLVVGEGQILAQVKKAYEHGITTASSASAAVTSSAEAPACTTGTAATACGGSTAKAAAPAGKVIARLLNTAVSSGKRVRAETGISKGAVSISSAAAEFTHSRLLSDCGVASGRMSDAKIVVIGAGKMARLLLVHLQSQGVRHVTIINRSLDRIHELAAEFPELNVEARLMTSLYDELIDADVVYPSTASETTIIDPEPLQRVVTERLRRQEQLPPPASMATEAMGRVTGRGGLHLVDISVPRNVHADCGFLEGVYAYTVDDLKAVVARNTAKRRREMLEAENILREEQHKFQQWQQSLSAIPTIAKLQEKAEAYRQEELHKAMKKLSQLSPGDLATVERVTKGIVAKLLHGPMHHLRQSNGAALAEGGNSGAANGATSSSKTAAASSGAKASTVSSKAAALDNATAVAAMMVGGDEGRAWSSSSASAAAMMSKMTAMRGGGGGGGVGGCIDATRAAILQVQRAFQLE